MSTTRSAADGPASVAAPSSPPPITAEAAPATPLAMPLETRAAHSSSSGVFTSRTACLMESGMGASGSASMNALASVVSLEMSSDAASAAFVYPSVAVASWRARSDCETRWIAAREKNRNRGGVRNEPMGRRSETVRRASRRGAAFVERV